MINISDAWYRISAKALILNDQWKFLLCKESDGEWDLPGWWLDHGESPTECIARELQEELWCEAVWIDTNPSYFVTAHKPASKKKPWIANVCYQVILRDLDFTPSEECTEIGFFDSDSIVDISVMPNVTALAKEMKKVAKFTKKNWQLFKIS